MAEVKQATIQTDAIKEYALSFEAPLEAQFFNQKQKDQLEKEKAKLDSTVQYVSAVLNNPELDQDLDKAVAIDKIYSPAMTATVRAKVRAYYDGMGERIDLAKSLISETGQFVLLSETVCSKTGVLVDGYFLKPEAGILIQALTEEGMEKLKLDKIREAAEKYGAIIVQRGSFSALKSMLEEALAIENVQHSYQEFKQKVENQDKAVDMAVQPKPVQPEKEPVLETAAAEHGSSLSALKSRLAPVSKPAAPAGPVMTSQEIKREVDTKELPAEKPFSSVKPLPKPEVQTAATRPMTAAPVKPAEAMELNKKVMSGLKGIDDIKTIDDLKKLEPAHLRQGILPDQIKKLKAKIVYLAAVNKQLPVVALGAFEQSPLFRQYLKIGGAAITAGDQKTGYLQVMARLKDAGEDVINLKEFEAIADLRKEMERL